MENVQWVAGLLEGEGSFFTQTNSASPRVACSMTDLDVLEKLRMSVGRGSIHPITKRQSHWKDAWIFTARGRDAEAIMDAIYPYMGKRRQAKISEVLKFYRENGRDFKHPKENQLRALAYYRENNCGLREAAAKFSVSKDTIAKLHKTTP